MAETRVLPTRATDDAGRDVLDVLSGAERTPWHALRPGRDSVTLAFDAPAPAGRTGAQRCWWKRPATTT